MRHVEVALRTLPGPAHVPLQRRRPQALRIIIFLDVLIKIAVAGRTRVFAKATSHAVARRRQHIPKGVVPPRVQHAQVAVVVTRNLRESRQPIQARSGRHVPVVMSSMSSWYFVMYGATSFGPNRRAQKQPSAPLTTTQQQNTKPRTISFIWKKGDAQQKRQEAIEATRFIV